MAVPIATIANVAKSALDLAKTENSAASSSENKVDLNRYEETPMEIKRTEGDLGYDEEKKEEETPQEHIDEDPTANPMDVKEVADVEETERPDSVLPTANDTENEVDAVNPFNQQSGAASTSNETGLSNLADVGKSIVSAGIDSAHTADSGSIPTGSVNGVSAISSSETGESNPLQIPATHAFSSMMEPDSPESKSLLEQAEEAYEDDKDIDAKELPFVSDEQAAEDVEDLITNEEIPDEKKEEILERAVEKEKDGKLEENDLQDEIAEEAGESNEEPKEEKKGIAATINGKIEEAENKWNNSEEKKLLDKGKDLAGKGVKLAQILYGFFGPPKSASASSGETVALNKYEDEKASTTSGGMGYGEEGTVESTSSHGSAPSSGSIAGYSGSKNESKLSTSDRVNSKVSTSAGKGSIENKVTSGSSSSASTSGSVRAAFENILKNGVKSGVTTGDSSLVDSGMKGAVGSVAKEEKSEPLRVAPQTQPELKGNPLLSEIHKEVAKDWKKWPERDGVHYKDKGSVAVFTEDGSNVLAKVGTRRVLPIEKLDSKKLEIVEEVI